LCNVKVRRKASRLGENVRSVASSGEQNYDHQRDGGDDFSP